MITFFNKLGIHLTDTYLVVIMAVSDICHGGFEVVEENLIRELHLVIIKMYEQSLVQQLSSCLKETIQTALNRYVSLGVLEKRSHTKQNGGIQTFYTSKQENKKKIEELTRKQVLAKAISNEEFLIWGDRIEQAVEQSLVITVGSHNNFKL